MKKIILQIALFFQVVVLVAAPNWEVNTSDYEFSMTITGIISPESGLSVGDNDMLGAFVGEECRGAVEVVYEADYDNYFFYLTVFSDEYEGEEVVFKYYNSTQDDVNTELDTVEFSSGGTLGTLAEPFDFSGTQTETGIAVQTHNLELNVYPNPAADKLEFNVNGESIKRISIYTLNGTLVKQVGINDNIVAVHDLLCGVYLIEVEGQNKKYTQRFIKQ